MSSYLQSSKRGGNVRGSGVMYKVKLFLITAATVFLVISFFWGESGFIRMWYLSKRIEKVKGDIKVLKVQRNDLLWETDKIKNDPEYIQHYAIEMYGYGRPEQRIIQFVPADSSGKGHVRPLRQK
jgi:cell division protein FtsB